MLQQDYLKKVIQYYEATTFDYGLWTTKESQAIHLGMYDENAEWHPEALLNTNRVLADLIGIAKGEKVLDAGCGWGGSCFWLAENRNAQVTGLNLVPKHHKRCLKNAKKRKKKGKSHPYFVIGDYTKTPFKSESFDVVWALETVCHAYDKKAFFKTKKLIHKIL